MGKIKLVLPLLVTLMSFSRANRDSPFMFKTIRVPVLNDSGDPLILTPLIEAGQIQEARDQARVQYENFGDVVSYAGYFTVDKLYENNLFFWFFPSENSPESDPVLLWLQGGPGSPSTYAIFEEHGPFVIDDDYNVSLREHRWTKNHSVIYIDQPVGTGWSFTRKEGYAENQTRVGDDLYQALLQFYQLFPELQKNDFFSTGESYAGKYVPAIGYAIHKNNPGASLKINLKGIAIGNGLSDPVNQADYADYLYQHGLVDYNTRSVLLQYKKYMEEAIKKEDYLLATDYFNVKMLEVIQDSSQISSIYNYLLESDDDDDAWQTYMQTNLRGALHVGNTPFNEGPVFEKLQADISKSVAPWIAELLSHYSVMLYSGQLDVVVAYPLTINYLQKLRFDGADEYANATRKILIDGTRIAGYYKKAGNLTEVLIRNAGHMVAGDQPERASRLIYDWVRGEL